MRRVGQQVDRLGQGVTDYPAARLTALVLQVAEIPAVCRDPYPAAHGGLVQLQLLGERSESDAGLGFERGDDRDGPPHGFETDEPTPSAITSATSSRTTE